MNRVESILISQPKPESNKSPYFDLEKKYGIKVDFRPFIHVEEVRAKEFRREKIKIEEHNSIIFTSRNSIEHFFRICNEMRIKMSAETKYFCTSEAIALYLQKFIQYRKRKVFFGTGKSKSLMDILSKHKDANRFLLPCTDIHKEDIPEFLDKNDFNYSKAVLYRTVCSDLSDLEDITYDMIVFFSPSGVKSLFQNFPEFKQNNTRIAAFGPTTSKAVVDSDLRLDLKAPIPKAPSMTMSIEQYLKKSNN